MKGNDIFYLVLSIVLICLLITYSIFVIVDETKKFKKISYYKSDMLMKQNGINIVQWSVNKN